MHMHTGLIAVSFHRLFLGGLLPSRARFRFAGYCHGMRCDWVPSSLQRSAANPRQGYYSTPAARRRVALGN
jgi:hypothetical protein